MKGKEHAEILPVFRDDNAMSLLLGEKREFSVLLRTVELDGWNALKVL